MIKQLPWLKIYITVSKKCHQDALWKVRPQCRLSSSQCGFLGAPPPAAFCELRIYRRVAASSLPIPPVPALSSWCTLSRGDATRVSANTLTQAAALFVLGGNCRRLRLIMRRVINRRVPRIDYAALNQVPPLFRKKGFSSSSRNVSDRCSKSGQANRC